MKNPAPAFEPRLRVSRNGRHLFGPGKAELLQFIADKGSIRAASAGLHMSYQRAWSLVQQMNLHFVDPLVVVSRGGGSGGGARLTKTGRRVLSLYVQMGKSCHAATRADWTALRRLLK